MPQEAKRPKFPPNLMLVIWERRPGSKKQEPLTSGKGHAVPKAEALYIAQERGITRTKFDNRVHDALKELRKKNTTPKIKLGKSEDGAKLFVQYSRETDKNNH